MEPEPRRIIQLPADGRAPSMARRRVREVVLDDAPPPGMEELASLLVSELVGNAVLHATPPATLTCTVRQSALRLEVTDSSPRPPQLATAGPSDTGGRGMLLVQTLSSRWGVESTPHGKLVWVEIDPEDAAAFDRGECPVFPDGT
ncbi:anti-sigma regulatory factor (Ser/Thr protein kinase) [Kineococcus xinjiangensis]|uniref:Anti-sigma regulatory factor (Ser/Thr protein kinase) n=1 Tax=Kineococcus xinjiangensis TaxID=512762 RepID=A0A2S6IFV2_9ACTN|nr:ATP-binding protein [Kineococcus xinjiangensis]PPK93102.1 anti-sigma regulatory factor (Ser/Thr protein kinase) [Kineococcus xinjiangensis]